MPEFFRSYVRTVEKVNDYIGLFAMYLVVAMLGVLLFSTYAKLSGSPSLWTLDMAQFIMVAYYMLGGGYTLRHGDHVRMDLMYGRWSPEKKAQIDVITDLTLIFFLIMLLIGGVSSTLYAIDYGERSFSMWRPYLWPVKVVMTFGVVMALLQAIAFFIKDLDAVLAKRGAESDETLVLKEALS